MTDKARELLERVLAGMDRYGDIYPETLEEIRAYLAQTEPTQDDGPVGQVGKCHTVTWFKKPEPLTYLFLHPAPRPEFVRLSEKEIMEIVRSDDEFDEMMWDDTSIRFARAIEDVLEEKNK